MPPHVIFDSISESLPILLESAKQGRTQLPDFQRNWVWNDEQIRSLLASLSLSYPIGAVMMLQTGNPKVRFQPRPIEGVTLSNSIEPDRLILDGQQRLTSLFQVFCTGMPVKTRNIRGKEIHHWYYIDIAKALNSNVDREDAIISVPEDKIIRNFRKEVLADYSTTEKECAAEVFPLHLVFDTPEYLNWMQRYLQVDPTHMQERFARWTSARRQKTKGRRQKVRKLVQ